MIHIRKPAGLLKRTAGVTLVETMVAMILFITVSVSITSAVVQMRKQAENTMSQALAESVAEGILEQIRQMGFTALSDLSVAYASAPTDFPGPSSNYEMTTSGGVSVNSYQSVPLKFLCVASNNHVDIQDFNLYWAAYTSSLSELGARADPSDPASTVLGILVDVDYTNNAGSVIINPRRYMKMKVSILRTVNANSDAVTVALNYQWQQPDRRIGTTPIYFSQREIRTVVSKIPTY